MEIDRVFKELDELVERIGDGSFKAEDEETRRLCEQIANQPKEEPTPEEIERWSRAMAEWIIGDPVIED